MNFSNVEVLVRTTDTPSADFFRIFPESGQNRLENSKAFVQFGVNILIRVEMRSFQILLLWGASDVSGYVSSLFDGRLGVGVRQFFDVGADRQGGWGAGFWFE